MSQAGASPKILVAPLDWGLGHATRCIPIVRELLRQNCQVILAASGRGQTLLQQEFPGLTFLHLPGYEIKYAATDWGLPFKIVAQIPKLLSAIKKEHAWLEKVVREEKISAVISDNRYGLWHPDVPSVFVTHQLRIKAPVATVENVLQHFNYRYINRFDECWVLDVEGEANLAGELSHPVVKPAIPLRYIGPLSRFDKNDYTSSNKHLLVLLSGPEPQRTLLEKLMVKELKTCTQLIVLVRGLPGETKLLNIAGNTTTHNHLPAAELGQKISDATLVISRCGYSTVMDLTALQKKSILIPTPGQTEQEYLSKHLMQRGFAFCVEQEKFKLNAALALADSFPYRLNFQADNVLGEAIKSLVKKTKAIWETAL